MKFHPFAPHCFVDVGCGGFFSNPPGVSQVERKPPSATTMEAHGGHELQLHTAPVVSSERLGDAAVQFGSKWRFDANTMFLAKIFRAF